MCVGEHTRAHTPTRLNRLPMGSRVPTWIICRASSGIFTLTEICCMRLFTRSTKWCCDILREQNHSMIELWPSFEEYFPLTMRRTILQKLAAASSTFVAMIANSRTKIMPLVRRGLRSKTFVLRSRFDQNRPTVLLFRTADSHFYESVIYAKLIFLCCL